MKRYTRSSGCADEEHCYSDFNGMDESPDGEFYLCSDVDAQIEYLGETLRGVMMSEDALKAHIARQDARIAELEDALAFYADPETYFAILFVPDPPCGEFMEDFSETDLGGKPGKLARETLGLMDSVNK